MYYPRLGSGAGIVGIGFVVDENRDGLWDASFWDTTGTYWSLKTKSPASLSL
jgi:hypothetical protein